MNSYPLLNNQHLAACSDCPLGGSKPVFSYFMDDDIDVLVIGQSPGYYEVEHSRPFVGRSGELINGVIHKYTNKIGYINSINCRPVNPGESKDRQPAASELKCCRERLQEDIKYATTELHPKVIFVLGGVAKKEWNRAVKANPELNNFVIYQAEHPAFILRNDHLRIGYIKNLQNCLKSVFTENENVEKTFLTYTDDLKFNFIEDYKNTEIVGVDIETNGLNMFSPDFVIGTFGVSCDKYSYFFDFRNGGDFRTCDALIDFLKDESVIKVFADVLYDVVSIQYKGVEVNNITDVFPLATIFDNTHYEYGLEALMMRYMPEFAAYKSRFKMNIVDHNFLDVDTDSLRIYNCFDSWGTKKLYELMYAKLRPQTKKIFDSVYVKLLPVLVSTKCTGMKVDTGLFDKYVEIFQNRYAEISELFNTKWNVSNINSTPQIKKWMFQDLKLKSIRKTKTGGQSTDKKVIEFYSEKVPDVKLLYEARRLASLLNYFMPSIRENLDDKNLIHPNYKHYGIQSGRISCKSPNLQGIPRDNTNIKVLDENPLRRMFVSRHSDSYILEFDYSQQEVRIVAFLSQDQNMIQAFNEGKDIHRFVASIVFNKPYEAISTFERQVAKGCVFGSIFGVSADELAFSLKVTKKQADSYIKKFFDNFPRVKLYIDTQGDIAVSRREVISALGMPRKFVLTGNNENDVRREGANHQIQSIGAAFTFLSLTRVYDKLKKDGLLGNGVLIIHNVHDSIMLDVEKIHLEYVINTVTNIMSSVPKYIGFNIAYPVDYKLGNRWGEELKIEEILTEQTV
jgi:DNA polymerase-1